MSTEYRPCAVCAAVLPVADMWPWTARRRICVPCLRAVDGADR